MTALQARLRGQYRVVYLQHHVSGYSGHDYRLANASITCRCVFITRFAALSTTRAPPSPFNSMLTGGTDFVRGLILMPYG